MCRRYLSIVSSLFILLNYLAIGMSAEYIAFVKDANLKSKCPLVEQNTFQIPFVMLRMAQTPLNAAVQAISQEVEDDFESEENSYDVAGYDHKRYRLIKISKSETQKFIDSGTLRLVESKDATPSKTQLHNENTDDVLDEDERSKKRPWRKIQRIIRRQLIKRPTRYFKKILHIFG